MKRLVRGIDALSTVLGTIAALTVVVLVVLMLYDVVLRYAFNAPTTWGNDLNTFLMGGAFVLSIAYALSTDSHVRVDLLYTERNRHYLNYVDLVGLTFIILPVVAWLTWGLWGYLLEGIRTGERTGSGGWNPVVWPFRVVLVLGFAMFTIQVFAEIVKRIAAISGKPIDTSSNADHGV